MTIESVITVITVSTHDLTQTAQGWEIEPFSDEAMATIHSVQAQTLEAHDLIILRRVDDSAVQDLYLFAAQRAETDWLTFVEEGQVLPPDYLQRLMDLTTAGTSMVGGSDTGVAVRRSYYLEGM
jgi:hypothetical protein